MSEPTAIPFNPVIPFHGDVKSFAMLGPFQGPMEFDGWRQVDVEKIPRLAKVE